MPNLAQRLFNKDEEIYSIAPPLYILIDRPWTDLSEEETAQLKKILDYIKNNLGLRSISINSVQIMQVSDQPLSTIKVEAPILAFGNCLREIETYTPVENGQSFVIQSESLHKLTNETKNKLAAALKSIIS
ncbi:MAG: hypothetical protein L0Y35_03345 [Flammeovirgaceae bacterium]|nr:hypothetical protein [Flammeovirgaceae bacterium]